MRGKRAFRTTAIDCNRLQSTAIEFPKNRRCPRSRGFTLVEVLIALALCVGLACAVSATIATCRRAEASADAAEQAARLIPTLLTAELLDQPVPDCPGWVVERTREKDWPLTTNLLVGVRSVTARSMDPDVPPVAIRTLAMPPRSGK